jgi:hypothetical protein
MQFGLDEGDEVARRYADRSESRPEVDGTSGSRRIVCQPMLTGSRYNRPVASRSTNVQAPPTPEIVQRRISQRSRSTASSSSGSSAGTRAWISTPAGKGSPLRPMKTSAYSVPDGAAS